MHDSKMSKKVSRNAKGDRYHRYVALGMWRCRKLKIKKLCEDNGQENGNVIIPSFTQGIVHDIQNEQTVEYNKDKVEQSEQSDYSEFSITEKLTIEKPTVCVKKLNC
jgi:hypothetical protein